MLTSSLSALSILLFGAIFLLLPAESREFGIVFLFPCLCCWLLSLGEERANQADSFDGFCFHCPWQKILLALLCHSCVMPQHACALHLLCCAFINSAFWTVTEYSFCATLAAVDIPP